uniref:PML C-terminal domain-containing protein n=1 Tax=Magallana gigas TaxID=29159 RepID=K1PW27_MAGGI
MVKKKAMSVATSRKIAGSGLGFRHIMLAHKRDELSGVKTILGEHDETETRDIDDELPTNVNGVNKCMEYVRIFMEENSCDNFSDNYALLEQFEMIALKKKRQSRITEFIDWIP